MGQFYAYRDPSRDYDKQIQICTPKGKWISTETFGFTNPRLVSAQHSNRDKHPHSIVAIVRRERDKMIEEIRKQNPDDPILRMWHK
ncbi:MAG: hypothetical protein ACREHG_10135 [Candidatus Saccharimonadales bacterium]